jgi:c-di-GMP-binding flagellar brake protein YcgR
MPDLVSVQVNDLLQVKLLDDPNSPNYRSHVEDVLSDMVHISWPTDRGVLIPISQNCPLSLSFIRNEVPYTFTANVEAREREPIPFLKVRPTSLAEKIQRRHYFRAKTTVPVELTGNTISGSDKPGEVHFFRTTTYDLSGGGISIRSEASVQVGTVLECKLALPDGQPPIKAPVRVVNCDPAAVHKEKQLNRIGMSFLVISEAERTRIVRHLFKVQMRQLAAG